MKKFLLAAALLAAASTPAAEREPSVNIFFTAENATCLAWMNSARNKAIRREVYEVWARGFASGHNYSTPRRQVKTDAFPTGEEFDRYFDQFCKENPQKSFVAGVIELVEQLADAAARPAAPARKPATK